MPIYIALLRGINLGGHNRIAMADLRRVVSGLGFTDVATYVQSGNVVFGSDRSDSGGLAAEIQRAIADELGVDAPVFVLPCAELAQVVADNPYPDEPNPKHVHAVLGGSPDPAEVAAAQERAAAKGSPDTARVVGSTLYLHTPEGLGRSELAVQLSRKRAPMAAGTARNWSTVTQLLAMCDRA